MSNVNEKIYIPFFDRKNDIYIDKSPYNFWTKNNMIYECCCKEGSCFKNNIQFKKHIKSQIHCNFIKNYKGLNEQHNLIKELRINNEKLLIKNNLLIDENNLLIDENNKLIDEKDLLKNQNYKLFELGQHLRETQNDINNQLNKPIIKKHDVSTFTNEDYFLMDKIFYDYNQS